MIEDFNPRKTWITSDSHFGHQNIVGFCHRPPDHEQIIMEEWAREVPPDGTVIHLGDLSYRNNGLFKNVISKHLTGERKFLIRGNHDHQRYSFYRASGFKQIRPMAFFYNEEGLSDATELIQGEYRISLSHYPWSEIDEERPINDADIRIHGHIHNSGYGTKLTPYIPFLKNHINVSVEQTHYRPVNLGMLLDACLYGKLPEENESRIEPFISATKGEVDND